MDACMPWCMHGWICICICICHIIWYPCACVLIVTSKSGHSAGRGTYLPICRWMFPCPSVESHHPADFLEKLMLLTMTSWCLWPPVLSLKSRLSSIPSLLQSKEKLRTTFQGWSICQGCSKAFEHLQLGSTWPAWPWEIPMFNKKRSENHEVIHQVKAKPTRRPEESRRIHSWKPLKFATSKFQGAFPAPEWLVWLIKPVRDLNIKILGGCGFSSPYICLSLQKQLPHFRNLRKFSSMTPPHAVPNVSMENLR